MARALRIDMPGLIYHVLNRGNNRQAVFYDENDYHYYLNLLKRYKKKFGFKLFAYCLMPNHAHLLMQRTEQGSLSRIMQSVTNAHTSRFHFKYQTHGHVWQGRYKSSIVSDDNYLLTAMQYIEQNPVRAGLVPKIDLYKWSSYLINIHSGQSRLIDRENNPVFNVLGNDETQRIEEYRELMKKKLEEKNLEDIRKSATTGLGYMSEKFQAKMNLIVKKKKRGRPRKIPQN